MTTVVMFSHGNVCIAIEFVFWLFGLSWFLASVEIVPTLVSKLTESDDGFLFFCFFRFIYLFILGSRNVSILQENENCGWKSSGVYGWIFKIWELWKVNCYSNIQRQKTNAKATTDKILKLFQQGFLFSNMYLLFFNY